MLDIKFKNLAKEIAKYMKEDKPKTSSYDTQAVVRRIEGNTAYVHIPGGIDETPVSKTIAAQKGDIVQVRVSGKKAFLVGNASAPPTDDKVANVAKTVATVAKQVADEADLKATDAQSMAKEATEKAEYTAQYFWYKDGTDSEAGAHVTEVPAEDFMQNPSGGNILIRSNVLRLRMALITLAELTGTAFTFYDPDTGQERLKLFEDGLDLTGKKFGGSETNRNYSFARMRPQSFAIGYHDAENREERISESFGHSGFNNFMYSRKTVWWDSAQMVLKYFISYILDDAGFRIVRDRSTSPYSTGSTSGHYEISTLTEDGLHMGGVQNYAYTDITPAEEERGSDTGMGDVKDIFRAVSTDDETLFLVGEVSADFTDDTKTRTVEIGMKIESDAEAGNIDKQLYGIINNLGWNTGVAGVIVDDIRM